MRSVTHLHFLAVRKDLMPTGVLHTIFATVRILVHILNDVTPPNTCVIGAEGNLTFPA